MNALLTALLYALRANCEATIRAIDIYMTVANSPVAEPEPEPEPAAPPLGCEHKNIMHAPAMGMPGRFICQDCKEEIQK